VRAAKAIHEKIKKITDKPVKWAVVLNSRPHYWLGNSYYHSIGTKIISSKSTDREIRATGEMLLNQMKGTLREKASGTAIVYSNILFEKEYIIRSGKKSAVIIDVGPAHTAGDSAVWLPDSKILFSGDVVFTERMVAVISTGNTKSWVNAFDTLMKLKPVLIVPGHGKVSNVKKAQQDTKEYLVYIRSRVKEKFDNMVGLQETIESVDQSKYKYLKNFDDLAKRNIHFLYLELEIEELK
jgi:glyoxylase-like metal-dependent hydrolase (beta-lactamase superfamily II)